MNITEFSATLYFKEKPNCTAEDLMNSWGKEGYGCEQDQKDGVFAGLRGATYIHLSHAKEIDLNHYPKIYDEMAQVDFNYDETFLINHREGFADFKNSKYEMKVVFRIEKNRDEPKIAQNEWNTTLLGIHQVIPIQAALIHHLGILIGKSDLDEFTAYASSQPGSPPPQFAPPMAFGILFQKKENVLKVWSTGLTEFDKQNVFLEEANSNLGEAFQIIFNAAYALTSNWPFKAGDTADVGGIPCRIQDGSLGEQPVLQFVPVRN